MIALSVLMLCAPSNRRRPFSYHGRLRVFLCFVRFLVKQIGINSENCIWICQVATVKSINHNVGALKELSWHRMSTEKYLLLIGGQCLENDFKIQSSVYCFQTQCAKLIIGLHNNCFSTQAPSTRIRIFLNPQLFRCGLASRPHVSGEYG